MARCSILTRQPMTIRAVSRRFVIPHATGSSAVQLAPSSTRSPRLRPHGATVNPEPPRKRGHTLASGPGCSHSVYFLVSEACSRSFLGLRRRADQRIIGPGLGLRIIADALTPRGNKPLNPWSPVPVVLDCVHQPTGLGSSRSGPCYLLVTERIDRPRGDYPGPVLVL